MYTVTFDISEDGQGMLCCIGLENGELDTDDACAHWAAALRLIAESIVDQMDTTLPYHTHDIPVTFHFDPMAYPDDEDFMVLIDDLRSHGAKALSLYDAGDVTDEDILRFSTWDISTEISSLEEIAERVGGLSMPHVKWALASAAALNKMISASQHQNAA